MSNGSDVSTHSGVSFLQGRTKLVDWWLTATAIFLTVLGVIAVFAGYISFRRFREIEAEARQNMEASKQHAEEARSLVEELKAKRTEAETVVQRLNAETVSKEPDKAEEAAESVQANPQMSPIDRAIAAAVLLQQQDKFDEAIKKWRSIADIVEGTDKELGGRAWFSVGYLLGRKGDYQAAMDANTKAIHLTPNNAAAYTNRGNAKSALGQHQAAIADHTEALRLNPNLAAAYINRGVSNSLLGRVNEARRDFEKALALAREAGDEDTAAQVAHRLADLNKSEDP